MERTIDSILNQFNKWVTEKHPISAHEWVDAAQFLNVLISDEHDKLFDLQQIVAQKKLKFLEGDTKGVVSRAKLEVEATDEYKDMHRQKAKIERIEEFIRIAKIQARLKDNEYRNN